ncbi:oplophorus-luciferin 2-monooxygenase non-catalytic subunit-like [Panulirus ornatus]|uniref:oplophorus-luciferin 2-monooxygenase non-catalytic subunit-like n=1 Tax=Panulirus ornatus TaxID=150431 RepID=UPI003A884016
MYSERVLAVLVLGWASVWASCPSSGNINPCKCRDETPGLIMDCSSVTSSAQLLSAFSHDMPDSSFQFFEIVKLSGRCPLEKIPANVFGSTTFMFVWFGQTEITTVDPQAFAGNELSMLELTIADANKLTSFPFESMGEMHSLYKLLLSNTKLDTISHVGPAPNLTQVSVTGSQVSSIVPQAFKDLGRLTRLDLHDNPLTSIQDGWFAASTSQPWVVYLDGCSISDISPGAFSGTLPSGVFLNGNQLTTLPEATFRPLLEHLQASDAAGDLAHYVDVTNNPLVCDCDIRWVVDSATLHPFLRDAVCSNGDVAGTNVVDLPSDFFASC